MANESNQINSEEEKGVLNRPLEQEENMPVSVG